MCGFVAIKDVSKAAELAVVGAHALQNRARTYAGAISSDGQYFYRFSAEGLAREVFDGKRLNQLHGRDALVHLRYPTVADAADRDNTQPIEGIYAGKPIAIGHNGNLTNTEELAALLPPDFKMKTTLDTEYILRLLELRQTGDLVKDLCGILPLLKGSYTLAIMTPELLIGIVDRSANRPLSLAKLEEGFCLASENCAFPTMRAQFISDVEAGTMVVITGTGHSTVRFAQPQQKRCVFELLYNSSQASDVFGIGVVGFRRKVGASLAKLFPASDAVDTIVTPIPDSGIPYAEGFSQDGGSGRDFQVIWRNHYVGRTFNAATQALRDEEVSRKFLFNGNAVRGKSVLVLDDSIVRGTTLPKVVEMLWSLGAREVHVRIGSPKIVQVCRYGIYMDEDQTDLIAGQCSTEEMRQKFNVTSLEFLPLEVLRSLLPDPEHYCFACMGEAYW